MLLGYDAYIMGMMDNLCNNLLGRRSIPLKIIV